MMEHNTMNMKWMNNEWMMNEQWMNVEWTMNECWMNNEFANECMNEWVILWNSWTELDSQDFMRIWVNY